MVDALVQALLGLSRFQKRLVQAGFDACCALASFTLVFAFLFPQIFPPTVSSRHSLAWGIAFSVMVLISAQIFGLYRAWVRYSGVRALRSVLVGVSAAGLTVWMLALMMGQSLNVAAIFIAVATTAGLMVFSRLVLRELFHLVRKSEKPRVVLYGAGDAGRQLVTSFAQSSTHQVVALIDDAPTLQGTEVHGVRIFPPSALEELHRRHQLEAVILCIPSISRERKGAILERLEPLGLPLKTLPSLADIFSGRKSVADLHEIAIEEVLGRDPVTADTVLLQKKVSGRSVMVTGGGGSIGKELCLQIAGLSPTHLVIVDSSEYALYSIVTALADSNLAKSIKVVPLLQSVLDTDALLGAMQSNRVQTVFHAAAFKHVPLIEANPFAGLLNNVFGTLAVLEQAQASDVDDFVLISTDKAVRPTNIMGASKRLAELLAQAFAATQSRMCISMVRFGNVLSSSGSVIPRFKQQIQAGGPVTVTHPEITRFFMTIPEAVELVLQASGMAKGGDLFLLDMGEPIKILDLAKRMIRLSGYQPIVQPVGGSDQNRPSPICLTSSGHDVQITFTGLRPGEKLYEELLISGDSEPTGHPKIFRARENYVVWQVLKPALERLRLAIDQRNLAMVRDVLESLDVGYRELRELR